MAISAFTARADPRSLSCTDRGGVGECLATKSMVMVAHASATTERTARIRSRDRAWLSSRRASMRCRRWFVMLAFENLEASAQPLEFLEDGLFAGR